MKTRKIVSAILFATLILILVLAIYSVSKKKPTSWEKYGRGLSALSAFHLATRNANRTPEDNLVVARVIENELLTRRDLTAAARARLQNRTRLAYLEALQGFRRRPVENNNVGFALDAALAFVYENGDTYAMGVDTHREMNMWDDEGWETVDWANAGWNPQDHAWGNLFTELAETAVRSREELTASRRAAAQEIAQEAGAKGAGVAAYINLAEQHTADPQNVHDVGVNHCLKGVIERLRNDQAGMELPSMEEITAAVPENHHLKNNITRTLDRVRQGERVMTLGATDTECLQRVWLRSKDPRNINTGQSIREALFDALADSVESNNVVCVNGRSSRILSSLILLDWDKRNWEIKKLEQFKNEIFAEAGKIIESVARQAVDSSDGEIRKAGLSYIAQTAAELRGIGEISDEAVERLAETMREEIGQMVDRRLATLEGAISSAQGEVIKAEAKAAVV